MQYEILYHVGSEPLSCYYLLGVWEGSSPEEALAASLPEAIAVARDVLFLPDDLPDERIAESIYALREDGLVCAADLSTL